MDPSWDLICWTKVFRFPGLGLVCQETASSRAHGFSTSQSRLARSRGRNYLTQFYRENLYLFVRFCEILSDWIHLLTFVKMIQDDPRWSRCSVSQCIPVQWIFSLLPLFPVNSARPQRLQLAVRYESWLDDKRLDVTPDLRLEIRNSNEFRIIRISWISKKS